MGALVLLHDLEESDILPPCLSFPLCEMRIALAPPPSAQSESFSAAGLSKVGTQGQFKKQRNGAALRKMAGKMWAAFRQVKSLTPQAPI